MYQHASDELPFRLVMSADPWSWLATLALELAGYPPILRNHRPGTLVHGTAVLPCDPLCHGCAMSFVGQTKQLNSPWPDTWVTIDTFVLGRSSPRCCGNCMCTRQVSRRIHRLSRVETRERLSSHHAAHQGREDLQRGVECALGDWHSTSRAPCPSSRATPAGRWGLVRARDAIPSCGRSLGAVSKNWEPCGA